MTLYHGTLQVGNVSVTNARGEAGQISLISDVDGVAMYEWYPIPSLDNPNFDNFTCAIGSDRYVALIVYV